jgi:serine/threonine protein kinase
MKFEPGAKVGPYQILGELGRGGMATVYRAYQPNLEREVAIKILPEFLVEQPGFKARFHREAVAVARLQHPNILSVFDHGEQDGVTYIVSEYVEGGTLAARLGAPIQLEYCVRILRPIADALDYAHSEGVIHRDVKPSNILLDRRGVPILSDFGLARVAEAADSERLTQTGAMVGTPTYMAPEQCSGQEAGAPADIYALAVIAFEMVTGRVPFSAPTPLGVIAAHQMTPPPSPRKFNPSLPQIVEQPLLAGLAKDPARRPETATDFVEALAAAVSSSPMQYPLTPPPATQLPPTPTAVHQVTPAPSYPPAAPPTPEPISSPSFTPPPAPPSAPASSPPYGAQYTPAYAPPAYTAPAYTPPAYTPPAYTPPASTSPYAPAQTPYAPAQWSPAKPARREGLPLWAILALWAGFGLGLIGLIAAVFWDLTVPDMSDGDRWWWLVIGFVSVAAMFVSIAAALGLGARDRWGPPFGWASVAVLGLSIIGSPLAAAVGWGLSQAKGTLVANPSKPGGGIRLGAAGGVGVLMLMLATGAAAWGWSHPYTTTAANIVTPSPTAPVACTILKPDTAITPAAVGSNCGFTVKSTELQLDCKNSGTALPNTLSIESYDFNKSASGGGGAISVDSAGCHMTAPSKRIETYMASRAKIDPGDAMLVADFAPGVLKFDLGLGYGCDDTGCVAADLYTVDNSVGAWDDSTQFPTQPETPTSGVNRLMMVVQSKQIRVWFNGKLIATQTAGRVHPAGTYRLYMENWETSGPIALLVSQFAVYRLATP